LTVEFVQWACHTGPASLIDAREKPLRRRKEKRNPELNETSVNRYLKSFNFLKAGRGRMSLLAENFKFLKGDPYHLTLISKSEEDQPPLASLLLFSNHFLIFCILMKYIENLGGRCAAFLGK
jgi:hypothetical protein